MPETIEAEYMAALTARAFERERARGVAATLAWAWYGSHQPPLGVSSAAAG
jgi:phage terminase large subunit-like protein